MAVWLKGTSWERPGRRSSQSPVRTGSVCPDSPDVQINCSSSTVSLLHPPNGSGDMGQSKNGDLQGQRMKVAVGGTRGHSRAERGSFPDLLVPSLTYFFLSQRVQRRVGH